MGHAAPWDRAAEAAVFNDDPIALRDRIAKGATLRGHNAQGVCLAQLANEHSSACYRVLRDCCADHLGASLHPACLHGQGCVLSRATPNQRAGLLLLLVQCGQVLPQLNLVLRYGCAYANKPLKDMDFGQWVPFLAFYLPWNTMGILTAGALASAPTDAVCVAYNFFPVAQDAHGRHGLRLTTGVSVGERVLSDGVCGVLTAVLERCTREEPDESALGLLRLALCNADDALHAMAVPIGAPLACELAFPTPDGAATVGWQAAFTWVALRERDTPGLRNVRRVRVDLDAGTRIVPLARLLPCDCSPGDPNTMTMVLAPHQVTRATPEGHVRVSAGAGGYGARHGECV